MNGLRNDRTNSFFINNSTAKYIPAPMMHNRIVRIPLFDISLEMTNIARDITAVAINAWKAFFQACLYFTSGIM